MKKTYKSKDEKTINDHIQDQIDHTINQIQKPLKVKITKVHEDSKYTDCKDVNTNEKHKYILTIGGNIRKGRIGVLFFLDNDAKIIIT